MRCQAGLQDYFGTLDRLEQMSYEEKRGFLTSLFQGTDGEGKPYGVYIKKVGKEFQLTVNARTFEAICDLNQDIKPLGKAPATRRIQNGRKGGYLREGSLTLHERSQVGLR